MSVTIEQVAEALRAYERETGKRPTWNAWRAERRRPHVETIRVRCGSWNAAMKAAGYEPNRPGTGKGLGPPHEPESPCANPACDRLRGEHGSIQRCSRCASYVQKTGHEWSAERVKASYRAAGDRRRVWTREAIIQAAQDWATAYGEPPASVDWNAYQARHELHDEQRARRTDALKGAIPPLATVYRVFGSWNAMMEEAGFTPRVPHGGGGNVARRRSMR